MTSPSSSGWRWPTGFHPEFASGSGAAVHAVIDQNNPLRARQIHIRTVPDYEIPATDVPSADTDPDLVELAELEVEMKRLAELADTSADAASAPSMGRVQIAARP